jgi:hypothetical protein
MALPSLLQVRNEAVKFMNDAGGGLRVDQLPPAGAPPAATVSPNLKSCR